MSDSDESTESTSDPQIEKEWGELRKILRNRASKVDESASIHRRAKELLAKDCTIKEQPTVDEHGEAILDREKACAIDPNPKNTGGQTPLNSPDTHAGYHVSRTVMLEQIRARQEATARKTREENMAQNAGPIAGWNQKLKEMSDNNVSPDTSIPVSAAGPLTPEIMPSEPINPKNTEDSNPFNSPTPSNTQTNTLRNANLPGPMRPARTGGGSEFLEQSEDLGPERSGLILLRAIQGGSLAAAELDVGERRVIVRILKDQGRTQDEISALLQVSRRTVVADYKFLREQDSMQVRGLEAYDVAGEVYSTAQNAIQKALAANKFRTVSQILKDMVDILQSLGILYRAPHVAKVGAIVGHVQAHQGYTKYMEKVGGEKEGVIDVLSQVMASIQDGKF